MPIIQVSKDENRQLQNIANILASSKKVVIITGAGISTNCGIPDFRSEDGLYSLIQSQYNKLSRPSTHPSTCPKPNPSTGGSLTPTASLKTALPTNVRGKDLFDARIWKDLTSTSVFYTFIASLRKKIRDEVKQTTPTHRFIRTIRDSRKLVRCYTQNIDGLESRLGLCMDLDRGKGIKSRFGKPSTVPRKSVSRGQMDGGCEVVPLHGDLGVLRCTQCQKTCGWEPRREAMLLKGTAPECFSCATADQQRRDRGKRGTKIGSLRPNIVLYGEEHPNADAVGSITTNDLSLSPDILLILGTSLHVKGVKTLVKEFAKCVHTRPKGKGKVIFVNLSQPSESIWKDSIDYWVSMDCDEWIGALRRHRPDIWQVQTELKAQITKKDVHKPLKPPAASGVKVTGLGERENGITEICKVVQIPRQGLVGQSETTALNEIQGNAPRRIIVEDSEAESVCSFVEYISSSQLPTPPPSKHKHHSPKQEDRGRRHWDELKTLLPPLWFKTEKTSVKRSRVADDIGDQYPVAKRKRQEVTIWED
ncbi:MAG: hypothetical protein Q9218_005438 [Villophora microphyllina]